MEKQFIYTGKKIFTSVLLAVVVVCLLIQVSCTKEVPLFSTPEMDAKLVSIAVNGNDYTIEYQPVQLITDQVFSFVVAMQNIGTETWGQHRSQGQRGSTLLSRDPDLNTAFGIDFISPGQGQNTAPNETFTFHTSLRAPSVPGEYTMKWQLADWIIPYHTDYADSPMYGDTVTVKVTVLPRTEQPPPPSPRKPGVLGGSDFAYIGSFTLPRVPDVEPRDEKAFFRSGITLRTAGGEKRMLLTTGTYGQNLYEVAIPTPGKFVGNDYSAVPEAELRTIFGPLTKDPRADNNGKMWYDEEAGLLYWTNFHAYYFPNPPEFPVLRSARLDGSVLTEVRQWLFPGGVTTHYKSFWGGITSIPEGFAMQYTGGRRLALGFGGVYSIVQTASNGPALAAISPDFQSGAINFQNIMYYPFPETCIRDGNYFYGGNQSANLYPTAPWAGTWTNGDRIGSGLFIDLPDKKGYVVFLRQIAGRIGYDYGGGTWNAVYQNAWYLYDYETLGKAATGQIPNNGIIPYDISIVEYPHDLTKAVQYVAGSCFDPETRRLYLYTMGALKTYNMYDNPVVHVYSVKND